jgi:uncharacterized membrane protein
MSANKLVKIIAIVFAIIIVALLAVLILVTPSPKGGGRNGAAVPSGR